LTLFERLEPYLTIEPEPDQYQQLAERMHSAQIAVAMAIKRLRERFHELVEDELAEIVTSAEGLNAERAALMAILGA